MASNFGVYLVPTLRELISISILILSGPDTPGTIFAAPN